MKETKIYQYLPIGKDYIIKEYNGKKYKINYLSKKDFKSTLKKENIVGYSELNPLRAPNNTIAKLYGIYDKPCFITEKNYGFVKGYIKTDNEKLIGVYEKPILSLILKILSVLLIGCLLTTICIFTFSKEPANEKPPVNSGEILDDSNEKPDKEIDEEKDEEENEATDKTPEDKEEIKNNIATEKPNNNSSNKTENNSSTTDKKPNKTDEPVKEEDSQTKDDNSDKVEKDLETLQNEELNEILKDDKGIDFPIYSLKKITVTNENHYVYFKNPSANIVLFQYIVTDEQGKLIYTTDLISPGKTEKWNAKAELKNGNYNYKVLVKTFTPKYKKETNKFTSSMNIIVK